MRKTNEQVTYIRSFLAGTGRVEEIVEHLCTKAGIEVPKQGG